MTDFGGITEPRTTFIGRTQTPENSGAVSGGGTYTLRVPVPTDATLGKIEIYGGTSGGAVKIRRFARTQGSGANWDFNQVGTDYSVTVVANTLNSFDVTSFGAQAGEYIAIVPAANTVRLTATTEDSQGYYWNGGDVTSFTLAKSNSGSDDRWEVRLTFSTLAIKQEILEIADFPPATGFEEIARTYSINGRPAMQVGFQDVDDQDPQAGFVRVYCGESNVLPVNGGLPAGSTFFDFTTYQYGGALKGWGAHGETVELQLACDTDINKNPEFSVRHRTGGVNRGSRIQTRNGMDTVGFGLNFQSDADPCLWLEDNADTPAAIGIYHPRPEGAIVSKIGGNQIHRIGAGGLLTTVSEAGAADAVAHEFVFGTNSRLKFGQGGSDSPDAGSGFIEVANGTGERSLRIASLSQSGADGSLISSVGLGSSQCYFLFGSIGEDATRFTFASNGSELGATLRVVNGDGGDAVRLDYSDPAFPFVGLEEDAPASQLGIWNPHAEGAVVIRAGANDVVTFPAAGGLNIRKSTAEPADPAEGNMALWLANGQGAGDEGDVMVKITIGGVTKTATLVDFSAL